MSHPRENRRIMGYCLISFLFLLLEKLHFHHLLWWFSVQQKYSIRFICFNFFTLFLCPLYIALFVISKSILSEIGRCLNVKKNLESFCHMFYFHIYRFYMHMLDNKFSILSLFLPYYDFYPRGESIIFEDTKSMVMNDFMYALKFDD